MERLDAAFLHFDLGKRLEVEDFLHDRGREGDNAHGSPVVIARLFELGLLAVLGLLGPRFFEVADDGVLHVACVGAQAHFAVGAFFVAVHVVQAQLRELRTRTVLLDCGHPVNLYLENGADKAYL